MNYPGRRACRLRTIRTSKRETNEHGAEDRLPRPVRVWGWPPKGTVLSRRTAVGRRRRLDRNSGAGARSVGFAWTNSLHAKLSLPVAYGLRHNPLVQLRRLVQLRSMSCTIVL